MSVEMAEFFSDIKGKRILLIWESVNWGGVESWLAYLLNDWPALDDNFMLLSNKGNLGAQRISSLLRRPKIIQLSFIHSCFSSNKFFLKSAAGNILCKILTPILFIIMINRYYWYIKKKNYDIVLAINGGYPAAFGVLASIIAAKLANIPVRSLVVHHEATKALPFLGWFLVLIDFCLSYTLTSVVSISKATEAALKANSSLFFNQNLHSVIIYNGIDIKKQTNLNETGSRALINPSFKKDNQFKFAMIGRVHPYKGHEDVIAAMSQLPPNIMKKTCLVVVGSSEKTDEDRLIAFSESLNFIGKIEFTGYLESEIIDEIRNFDAVIVATRNFEGFGLTAAEAMLAKVPLISTTAGALKEFVHDGVATCFAPGDVYELNKIINDFCMNPLPFRDKIEVAYNHIQNFTSKKMALKYQQHLIQNLVRNKVYTKNL